MKKINNLIPYNKQSIDEDDIQSVINVLRSDYITTGPEAEKFEKSIAKYCDVSYVLVCSNATSALQIVLEALNIGPKDCVVSSTISFVAGANATRQVGAEVCFCDVDPQTGNIDFEHLEKVLVENKNIKVVIPVHLAGAPVDMERLQILSKIYNFKVLEDACHALGGGYWDKNNIYNKIGNCKHSDVVVFSFHPIKNITTGEGGAITTNNKKLYKKMLALRNHGITRDEKKFINKEMAYTEYKGKVQLNKWYYEMHCLAHNFRLTDFQCALGNSQLKKLNLFVKKRQNLANLYISLINKEIKKNVKIPNFSNNIVHAFHLFVVFIDFDRINGGRANLMNFLLENKIQTQVHYIPIHLQPFYKKLYPSKFNLPNSELFYNKSISLPLFYDMTEDQVGFVIHKLKEGLEVLKV